MPPVIYMVAGDYDNTRPGTLKMSLPAPAIAANLAKIHQELSILETDNVAPPSLLAVSKRQSVPSMEAALLAGHTMFAENRVQEAFEKWPPLLERYPTTTLHLIGPLQTNKVKDAVQLFDAIHTVDREKLALAISKLLRQDDIKTNQLFVQVNTGEEAQKAGILPGEAAEFVQHCKEDLRLPIVGLMCLPPQEEPANLHFAWLARTAKELGLPCLSMGMSGDWPQAVKLGATHIRVGTRIFGARD